MSHLQVIPRSPKPHMTNIAGNVRGGGINCDHCALCRYDPVITGGIRPEPRSKSADHCWHVRYQFRGLSAEIAVYAANIAKLPELLKWPRD